MSSVIIASGAGAIQGGIIVAGLLAVFSVLPMACYCAFVKKRRSSLVIVLCYVALFVSIGVAGAFGPPDPWTYWGSYLPWIPLMISSLSLMLSYKVRPNQALQHNDPSCHVSCLRTPRASRDRG